MADPINATGWTELMNGDLIGAAYNMYNTATFGWFIIILFCMFQTMLFIKTRNLTMMWITGAFMLSLFAASTIFTAFTLQFMFVLLVIELAGILYFVFWA